MANRKLNSIKFPDIADTYILDADKVNYDDSETYASGSVGKALQTKADNDGSYSNMTVGNAEQLVSNVRVNDKTPYLFRTSGGSVDIGDREYVNGIVGGTVAWNQICTAGNFATSTGWTALDSTFSISNNIGSFTATATNGKISSTIRITNNHIYLAMAQVKASTTDVRMDWWTKNKYVSTVGTFATVATIDKIAYEGTQINYPRFIDGRSSDWDEVQVKQVMVFDLTQMFGSTVADYIYSLEQATEGAGVAWFRKLFNKPYYAYNAGELKSVSGLVSHDMTGFNQWDEEWEVGTINWTSGADSESSAYIRSKNYIPIIGGASYCFMFGEGFAHKGNAFWYDSDKKFITPNFVNNIASSAVKTAPINACYMRFSPYDTYGNTYNHDICINLSWDGSRNGEYEPYELHSYPLDSDLTLRGIPKLDANNSLYYDGDTYEADGTVTRKYGIVDLGTLTWSSITTTGDHWRFYTTYDLAKTVASSSALPNFVCSKYETINATISWGGNKSGIATQPNGVHTVIMVSDENYTDAAAFKTAMSGVYLVYELATPTTETADPYQQTQIVNDFGTEEYVISDGTFAVPVGHDTDYPVNLVAKLEMAPNSPEGNGDYIVRQTNGTNEYVPLVIEDALPTMPSEAGSYKLTVTVAEGSDPVLSWTAE